MRKVALLFLIACIGFLVLGLKLSHQMVQTEDGTSVPLSFNDKPAIPHVESDVPQYVVTHQDTDGYYHARDPFGKYYDVVFVQKNIRGEDVAPGDTVSIALDAHGENPIVTLKEEK